MGNTKGWWDNFWVKRTSPSTVGSGDYPYSDLMGKVACEYWHDKFKQLAPGKRMLECGCGSARVSAYMAQHGYQCTLLDYSGAALAQAKANFTRMSLDAGFIIGNLNQLCFKNGQFDIVFSGGVLEFFENAQQPINEMVSVLKPGGIFAAHLVPRKFSIQTIADIERTIACSIANLCRCRFKNVFKVVRNIPDDYEVSGLPLEKYIEMCKKAGLSSVTGFVTTPFPVLALPGAFQKAYVSLMRKLMPFWRRFNESNNFFSKHLGITYTIYGIKDN
ncbi:MAG: class I SAM-dependent methyltransferase [Candidatus Omnitrophica bacterium]|nr:class I SAM-dependent methyltransferase [Candidatus Omnitrophota bacterium]